VVGKVLDAMHLTKLFSAISGSVTFDTKKADPGPIIETVRAVSGSPSRAIMVGDSNTDISSARAATIPIIAVNYGYSKAPIESYFPDFIASHGSEIVSAVGEIQRNWSA